MTAGNEEDARPYPAEELMGSPEDTAVLNLGEQMVNDARREFFGVPDAPAEDGREADGSTWSYDGRSPLGRLSDMAKAVTYGSGQSFAQRSAEALRTDQALGGGPWPVRQWYAPDGGMPEAWEMPNELICALNVAGEAFAVWVWWASPLTRMVRVTWGVALDWTGDELASMVESWPGE
jgi:hypothetical protein